MANVWCRVAVRDLLKAKVRDQIRELLEQKSSDDGTFQKKLNELYEVCVVEDRTTMFNDYTGYDGDFVLQDIINDFGGWSALGTHYNIYNCT